MVVKKKILFIEIDSDLKKRLKNKANDKEISLARLCENILRNGVK